MTKVYIWPTFSGEDKGDGGVRRVVDAQRGMLPGYGIEIVDSIEEADVVAAHISAPRQVLNTSKPLVAHCHGLYWSEYEWENWALQANTDVLDLCKRADAITAPAEWVADNLRRNLMRPVQAIPHGVALPLEGAGEPEDPPYVLWNKTRPDPVCNPEPLDALAAMLPGQRFVSTFGKDANNVTLTGRLPYTEAIDTLRRASVYLATSRETFGIGTLEALAYGVPVVGFDFGGQHEFIEHKVDGYLVPPGDIEGLAEGVRWALEEADPAKCRAKAEEYPWSRAIEQYADLYHRLAGEAKEEAPRTTIIVTAYNLEKYLPETLQSVAGQSDQDWECIIVDDASPDRCGEIADGVAARDSRFKVIHNEENLYLARSRNRALGHARGRYVMSLDADDYLPANAVEILADALDADRSLHIAYGRVHFIREDGNSEDYGHGPGRSQWPLPWDANKQIAGQNLCPYSSMIRRSALRNLGGWRARLRTSEDADLWTRAAMYGYRGELVTGENTLVYRNRPGSMSREHQDRRNDYQLWYPWSRQRLWMPAGVSNKPSLLHPKVAVLIPCGEYHRTLVQDAVDSVLSQTHPRAVPIVAGPGERPIALPAAAVWISSESTDPAHLRNIAAQWAFDSLPVTHVLPLDADDYLQLNAIDVLLRASSEHPGEVLYTDFWQDPEAPGQFRVYTVPDYDARLLTRKGSIHAVTALIGKDEWYRVGGFTEAGLGWEDWDLQLKLAEAGICSRRVPFPLFFYRKHSGQRRIYTQEEFERRKAQIQQRFSRYFEGEQLMACGCKGKKANITSEQEVSGTSTVVKSTSNTRQTLRRGDLANDDAVLVQYRGSSPTPVVYRGNSGTRYTFSKHNIERYVAAKDVGVFLGNKDFHVIMNNPEPVA